MLEFMFLVLLMSYEFRIYFAKQQIFTKKSRVINVFSKK